MGLASRWWPSAPSTLREQQELENVLRPDPVDRQPDE